MPDATPGGAPIARGDLELRERSAYAVLLTGWAGLALLLALDLGFASGGGDAASLLGLGAIPYGAAALVTALCRRSWKATSWLFGTWVFMTASALLFLVQQTVLNQRSGFLSELVYLVPTVLQAPVVLTAATVAAVLYHRDLDRF